MSTLADSMLSWKANLTTGATPEQVLTLRADVNAFADGVRFLESENAKLRELVKAMEPFLCCMPFASCNTLAANVRKRMRELGIKEDE